MAAYLTNIDKRAGEAFSKYWLGKHEDSEIPEVMAREIRAALAELRDKIRHFIKEKAVTIGDIDLFVFNIVGDALDKEPGDD